jgi:uncharacterized repeat protein (TIGR03803 family)
VLNKNFCNFIIRTAVVFALVAMSLGSTWAATTEKVLYNFTGGNDGGDPASQLTFDTAGNAYGTTVTGGAFGCGTVFKLSPSGGGQWQQSVLYSFGCSNDGKNPYGGVTLDAAGNLYGTTAAGGTGTCTGDGCGVVFKLTRSGGSWTASVLYSFAGGTDGYGPGGMVVFDRAGNLYGTTPDGGAYSQGTVYQLSLNGGQWQEKVIHDFTGGNDGAVGSLGALLIDSSGAIYGVTELGGANGAGTVFRMFSFKSTWNLVTLYAFKGQPDAGFPYGGLIADANGNLYGTTYYGGANGAGAVFKVGPGASAIAGWRDVVLYSFQGGTDGGSPTSTLVFDEAGNLYGTTSAGGDPGCECGVAFELSPNGGGAWYESVLHTFGSIPDGSYPYYGMTPDGMGNFFGTTATGGHHQQGTVFELTP